MDSAALIVSYRPPKEFEKEIKQMSEEWGSFIVQLGLKEE